MLASRHPGPTSRVRLGPSVAFCIVGQPRGFIHVPAIADSIRKYALEAVGGQSDVFLNIKVNSDETARAVLAVGRRLGALRVLLRSDEEDQRLGSSLNSSCPLKGFRRNFAQQSLDQADCLGLIRTAERRRGQQYDVIVKMRPDEQLCTPLPSARELAASAELLHWRPSYTDRPDALDDHMAIIPRRAAKRYFTAYSAVLTPECPKWEPYARACHYEVDHPNNGFDFPNECLMLVWLSGGNISLNGKRLGHRGTCLWRTATAAQPEHCTCECIQATPSKRTPGYCPPPARAVSESE